MTETIPDFSEDERHLVTHTLFERYQRAVPFELGEAEIQLIPDSERLTNCPVLYWEARGAHFVIFKLGPERFRAQFFYSDAQQYSTGHDAYDSLGDCLITVLQVQADHERDLGRLRDGLTKVAPIEEDDGGPIIT